MPIHHVCECAKLDDSFVVSRMDYTFSIRRFDRLLQREQELRQTALTGAVYSEENRQRRKAQITRVSPCFESLNS